MIERTTRLHRPESSSSFQYINHKDICVTNAWYTDESWFLGNTSQGANIRTRSILVTHNFLLPQRVLASKSIPKLEISITDLVPARRKQTA